MVECLTRDRRAAGSSLTGVTALWSLSKTHLSQLSYWFNPGRASRITERLLSGRKESNQTKTKQNFLGSCQRLNINYHFAKLIIETRHEISKNVVYATSKGSDQTAHTCSLIRAFASCLNIPWILSY